MRPGARQPHAANRHPGYDEIVQAAAIKQLARECGFELVGIAPAEPLANDFARYAAWADSGMAGRMSYLTDHRAEKRRDPRTLLSAARSVICVGKLYNRPSPESHPGDATFSRYAWTRDYHDVLRELLEQLAGRIAEHTPHEWKACVDTAPLLERSYARRAGLGWIGKNQCLINEPRGSWFFLGELLTSLVIEPDSPPPDRCGTCTRCIDACPTQAIVPCQESPNETAGQHSGNSSPYQLDASRCITYLNIELKGPIPEDFRAAMGTNIIGCDICQDVCPWNRRAPVTEDTAFEAAYDPAPPLESLASLTKEEFENQYRNTPVTRPKYDGFLRNVAVAMGASPHEQFREPLDRLARHASPVVAEHAQWALHRLNGSPRSNECVEVSHS